MDKRDQDILEGVKRDILLLHQRNYQELEESKGWGRAVKTEKQKETVALKVVRLGLFGALYDINNLPPLETFQQWLTEAQSR
jgi:hypothetical protein